MQNSAITLRQLSQGIRSVGSTSSQAGGINSAVSQTQDQPTLVQVAQPVNYESVNLQNVNDNSDEVFQTSFFNGTGATQNWVLGGMFSLAGQYQFFNLTPSAVDFATFQDIGGTAFPANTGTGQSLAQRFALMPAVIHEIWLQSNLSVQSTQNLVQGYITKSLNPKETTIFTSMCDACDNNNTTLFTKKFLGTKPVGKNNYIKIPIVKMTDIVKDFTTVRIVWTGENQVANLTPAVSF